MNYRGMFFLILALLIMVRVATYSSLHQNSFPQENSSEKITKTFLVTEDPDWGRDRTQVIFGNEGILARFPAGTQVAYGERLTVTGRLEFPEPFLTESGRIFDYPRFLAIHDIYGILTVEDSMRETTPSSFVSMSLLYNFKKYFVDHLQKLFSQDAAGLLAGMMVGEKSLLSKEALKDFQIAGLTHVIVLSGSNITIIVTAGISLLALLGCGYRTRYSMTLMIIPLFIMMTGLDASALRAGIMAMLQSVLFITLRSGNVFRIILYTTLGILCYNPRIVFYDPSFHLSLIAFMGVVYTVPWLEEQISFEGWFGVKRILLETGAVQVTVLPYLLWMSGTTSILTLVANLLTIPLIPLLMATGLGAWMITHISPVLGTPFVMVTQGGLDYMMGVAHLITLCEWAQVTIPPFSPLWLLGGYLGYGYFFMKRDILQVFSHLREEKKFIRTS